MIYMFFAVVILLIGYYVHFKSLANDSDYSSTSSTTISYKEEKQETSKDFYKYYQKFDSEYDVSLGYQWFKICLNYINYPNYNELGSRLQAVRKKCGITQVSAAKSINKSSSTLSSYENSSTLPSRQTLVMLSELYQVSLSFLEKACASNLKEQIELCLKYGEEEYISSISVSVRAAYRYFYDKLNANELELCEYINQTLGLKESPNYE